MLQLNTLSKNNNIFLQFHLTGSFRKYLRWKQIGLNVHTTYPFVSGDTLNMYFLEGSIYAHYIIMSVIVFSVWLSGNTLFSSFCFWPFDFCLLSNQSVISRGGALSASSSSASVETEQSTTEIWLHQSAKGLKKELEVVYECFLWAGCPLGRDMWCCISNAQNSVNKEWTLHVSSCMLWLLWTLTFERTMLFFNGNHQKHRFCFH